MDAVADDQPVGGADQPRVAVFDFFDDTAAATEELEQDVSERAGRRAAERTPYGESPDDTEPDEGLESAGDDVRDDANGAEGAWADAEDDG